MPLLDVEGLKIYFYTNDTVVKAADGVSFSVDKGETLAIVGESGSGKSVSSLSIMGLIPSPPGKIVGGKVLFDGRDLLTLPEREMRRIRGNDIAMIFQDPMSSLNPSYTVGNQIVETLRLHRNLQGRAARKEAEHMLELVGIPDAAKRLRQYPHEYSGGMRQRAMIAMALSCNPRLLIADEPTTALDVTVQKQILRLMKRVQEEFHTAIILITHDLGVVAEMCDNVQVMYAGRCIEYSDVFRLFDRPLHPYTEGLLSSQPKLNQTAPLEPIRGFPPDLSDLGAGCPFFPRCPHGTELCERQNPPSREQAPTRFVSCHHPRFSEE